MTLGSCAAFRPAVRFESLESRAYFSATPTSAQLSALTSSSSAITMSANSSSTATTRAVTHPLGGNLNSQSDRVQDLAFVDLVKTTRGFYNTAGRKASNGNTAFANTDANGWPTEDFTFNGVDNPEWNVPVDAGT